MTVFVRDYLMSIVAISLFSTILLALVPSSGIHRTLKFLCGLLLMLVTIAPLIQLEIQPWEMTEMTYPTENLETQQQAWTAELIKEEAEAYIWDKAKALGYDLQVEVEVGYTENYPYPEKVVITGEIDPIHRDILSSELENNLAIPVEKQEWYDHG